MAIYTPRPTRWNIEELNAGARDEGFKSWADLKSRVMDSIKKRNISARILHNVERNKGKYIPPEVPFTSEQRREGRLASGKKYRETHGVGSVRHLSDGRWVYHRQRGAGEPVYAKTREALQKKMDPLIEASRKSSSEHLRGMAAVLNKARGNVDQWTKNWFDKNLNKYGIRDLNKAWGQIKKDWKAEVKANPAKYTDRTFKPITPSGFPNITP